MKRLTKWIDVYGDGELEAVQTVKTVAQEELNGTLNVVNVDNWRQFLGKLAAYEDLGTPEQLAARVEVVRCEDCIEYTPYLADSECRVRNEGKCGITMGTRPSHHFCAWGERRE